MFLIDDILLSPLKGALWVFREVHKAAQEALADEAETLTAELSELYMMLDSGRITEEEFETREKELLDRLDRLQGHEAASEQDPETNGEEELQVHHR